MAAEGDRRGGFQILSLKPRTMPPHRAGPRQPEAWAVFVGEHCAGRQLSFGSGITT
jgi:hypothetical protein